MKDLDKVRWTCDRCGQDMVQTVTSNTDLQIPACRACGKRLRLLTREPEQPEWTRKGATQ